MEKTNQQRTLPVLWKDSNSATAELIKAGKFESVPVPSKVADILDCEPIYGMISIVGKVRVIQYLEHAIIKLAGNVNINPALNIKDFQVPVIAEMLSENYKWESLEDFTLCFRKGAAGMYGEIFRLDGAVLGQWMSKYLDEKYDALEQRRAKEKYQEAKAEPETVDGTKYINQILESLGKPKEENNANENKFQRDKLNYNPLPKEDVVKKKLHLEYIKENYDAVTGKKKEGWVSESEWLER